MDVSEFRELGLLHELNRRFLHPLGLALEVVIDPEGDEHFGRIWDYRDDPEGIVFDGLDMEKINRVRELESERFPRRSAALGYIVQPAGDDMDIVSQIPMIECLTGSKFSHTVRDDDFGVTVLMFDKMEIYLRD